MTPLRIIGFLAIAVVATAPLLSPPADESSPILARAEAGDSIGENGTVQSAASTPFLAAIGQVGGASSAVRLDGEVAFVGLGPRLMAVHVGEPAQPRLLGTSEALPGVVIDAHVEAGRAIVAYRSAPPETGGSGVGVFDVANPSTPTLVVTYESGWGIQQLAASGDLVYVAEQRSEHGALETLRVSGGGSLASLATAETRGEVIGIALDEKRALLVEQRTCSSDVREVDVSDPASPRFRALESISAAGRTMMLDDLLVVAAEWGGTTTAVGAAVPLAPKRLSQHLQDWSVCAGGLWIADATVYRTDPCANRLWGLDLTLPSEPRESAAMEVLDGPDALVVEDEYAVIGTRSPAGLAIIDVGQADRGRRGGPGKPWAAQRALLLATPTCMSPERNRWCTSWTCPMANGHRWCRRCVGHSRFST